MNILESGYLHAGNQLPPLKYYKVNDSIQKNYVYNKKKEDSFSLENSHYNSPQSPRSIFYSPKSIRDSKPSIKDQYSPRYSNETNTSKKISHISPTSPRSKLNNQVHMPPIHQSQPYLPVLPFNMFSPYQNSANMAENFLSMLDPRRAALQTKNQEIAEVLERQSKMIESLTDKIEKAAKLNTEVSSKNKIYKLKLKTLEHEKELHATLLKQQEQIEILTSRSNNSGLYNSRLDTLGSPFSPKGFAPSPSHIMENVFQLGGGITPPMPYYPPFMMAPQPYPGGYGPLLPFEQHAHKKKKHKHRHHRDRSHDRNAGRTKDSKKSGPRDKNFTHRMLNACLWAMVYTPLLYWARSKKMMEPFLELKQKNPQRTSLFIISAVKENLNSYFEDPDMTYDIFEDPSGILDPQETIVNRAELCLKTLNDLVSQLADFILKNKMEKKIIEYYAGFLDDFIIPNEVMTKYELRRLNFSAFGCLTKIREKDMNMIILGNFIIRNLIGNVMLKARDWNSSVDWTDHAIASMRSLGSCLYYITKNIMSELCPKIINNDVSKLKVKALEPIEFEDWISNPEDDEMIIGLGDYAKAKLIFEGKLRVETNKIIGGLNQIGRIILDLIKSFKTKRTMAVTKTSV